MRILVTASTLPRWAGDAMPAFVLDQARALRRLDPALEIHVLAPHHAGAARAETIDGIAIRRFRYFRPSRFQRLAYPAILPNLRERPVLWLQVPFLFVAEFLAILAFCLRHRPDAIYSHWFAPQGIAGGAVALLTGIPHLMTTHSSDVAVMRRVPWFGPALVRFFVRRMRACTAVSRRTRGKLLAFFPDAADRAAIEAKTLTLPMGVDLAAHRPIDAADRDELRVAMGIAGQTAYLFLGRLTAKKGLDVLLDAFALRLAAGDEATLLIAGEGELRPELERRLQSPALRGRARLLGFVAGEGKRRLLSAADVLVLPSVVTADDDAEGLPVVLLEGLAAGLACIATDVSGADDLLADGADGFLVPQRDPAALAAAMARVAALGPDAREAVGARARERARAYDWGTVAAAHRDHLFG